MDLLNTIILLLVLVVLGITAVKVVKWTVKIFLIIVIFALLLAVAISSGLLPIL